MKKEIYTDLEEKKEYPKTFKELFEGTGIKEKIDVDGNKKWEFHAQKRINIPNPADKGCIIYVDNDDNEISRDYGNSSKIQMIKKDDIWYRIIPETKDSVLMWEISDTEKRTMNVWCINAEENSLKQAIEKFKKEI